MKSRIELTSAERKARDQAILLQLAEFNKKNEIEVDSLVLYILHTRFGFGKKRLKRFYDAFGEGMDELKSRYELDDCDNAWLCTRKLKEAKIDILEWDNEKMR